MIVKSVEIKNFMGLSQATLNLENRGLVLITGVNEDDSSADSNGSSKSSLVDSLCWCLYGETARGVASDDVVNDQVKKDCMVKATILDGEDVFEITRYRQDSKFNNSIKVVINGIDHSKPTNAENDSLIEKMVGMSLEVFKVSTYCAQESMPCLPAMTDKQIKELIENASGMGGMQLAYDLAKQQKTENLASYEALTQRIKGLEAEIQDLQVSCSSASRQIDNWEEQQALTIALHEKEQEELKQKYLGEVAKFQLEFGKDVAPRIKEIQAEFNRTKDIRDQLEEANVAVTTALYACDALSTTMQRRTMDFEHIKGEINEIKKGVLISCPTCGQPLSSGSREEAISKKYAELDEIKKLQERDDFDLKRLAKDLENAQKARDEIKAKVPDLSALTKELDELNFYNTNKQKQFNFLLERKGFLQSQQVKIETEKTAVNPYKSAVQSYNSMLDKKQQELQKVKNDSSDTLKQITIDENLVNVFSPAGIRAHILDTVTPFLNSRTNKYLNTLSGGNLCAEWNTVTVDKKGKIKEKFQIIAKNFLGAKNYKGLSGGEKRKVNLACVLALQDLASAKANKHFSLWIGDEIDDALDSTGLELLMNVLNEKLQERGTILIISHNDLKAWISQNIVVTKKNKVSTINEQ